MTPTAQADAALTATAPAPTTAASTSQLEEYAVNQNNAAADISIAVHDTRTETPIRASINEAGRVIEAVPAAANTHRVTVTPEEKNQKKTSWWIPNPSCCCEIVLKSATNP